MHSTHSNVAHGEYTDPYDWRAPAPEQLYTDDLSTLAGLPFPLNISSYAPPSPFYAPSSFPSQQPFLEAAQAFPHSYAGTPSPLLFHNAQIPQYPPLRGASPAANLVGSPYAQFVDSDVLALQMGMGMAAPQAMGHAHSGSVSGIGRSMSGRGGGVSASRPAQARAHMTSVHPDSSAGGPSSSRPAVPEYFARPLPVPRRQRSANNSNASSTATSPIQSSPFLAKRLSMVEAGTRLASQPVSPRPHAAIDYSFNSLETDLDLFNHAQAGAFESAAVAAMASISTRGTAANSPSASTDAASPHVTSDSFFATLPTRSAGPSNAASPRDNLVVNPLVTSPAVTSPGVPSKEASPIEPAANTPSSSFDALFDGDSPESVARKDPIAAQAWRMINKAKHNMPNGARMENLTWRLMSMTLKKRREETAAAEAEVKALAEAQALADARVPAPKATVKIEAEGPAPAPAPEPSEAVGVARGRRGRTPASQSASASPEPETYVSQSWGTLADDLSDGMDWRAKSQSRSRSRAPDATMDWRAQSRSRSRAPIFRAPVPLAPLASFDTVSAQHITSRFYGDRGGIATPAEEKAEFDLAASLGLGPGGFSTNDEFDAFPSVSGVSPSFASDADGTTSNLTAIEDTLNHLISLQTLVGSPASGTSWNISSQPASLPRSPSKSVPAPSYANSYTNGTTPSIEEEVASVDDYSYLHNPSRRSSVSSVKSAHHQLQALTDSVRASGSRSPLTFLPQSKSLASASPLSRSPASTSYLPPRPYGFTPVAASGLSLGRPAQPLPESTHHAPASRLDMLAGINANLYSSSAPLQNFVNPPSYFGGLGTDTAGLLEYFSATSTDPYQLPYLANGFDALAPTYINPSHVNPSHLFGNGLYDSDTSSWAFGSPTLSPSLTETPSPPSSKTTYRPVLPRSHLASGSSVAASRAGSSLSMRQTDAVNPPILSSSAPVSRIHSRANTGPPHGFDASKPTAKPAGIPVGEDGEVHCLNCNTTVSLTSRTRTLADSLVARTRPCGDATRRASRCATRVAYSGTCTVSTDPPRSTRA